MSIASPRVGLSPRLGISEEDAAVVQDTKKWLANHAAGMLKLLVKDMALAKPEDPRGWASALPRYSKSGSTRWGECTA